MYGSEKKRMVCAVERGMDLQDLAPSTSGGLVFGFGDRQSFDRKKIFGVK